MPDAEFEAAKHALYTRLATRFSRLEYEALFFWDVIAHDGSSYDYFAPKRAALDKLEKEELLAFYDVRLKLTFLCPICYYFPTF